MTGKMPVTTYYHNDIVKKDRDYAKEHGLHPKMVCVSRKKNWWYLDFPQETQAEVDMVFYGKAYPFYDWSEVESLLK